MTGYADPELIIGKWLEAHLDPQTKVWMDPRLPYANQFQAPVVHVQRGTGFGTAALSLDDVTLDVDVYAAVADHARATAAKIWSLMVLTLPLYTFPNGPFVTLSTAITPPLWAPDPNVYRRTAAYRVVLHGFVS